MNEDNSEFIPTFRIRNDTFLPNNVRWKDIIEGRVIDTIIERDPFGRIISIETRPIRLTNIGGRWYFEF